MKKDIPLSFFGKPTLEVAESLIGSYLVRKIDGKISRYLITETEAYDGFSDRASHAWRGMTKRNAIMFGPAGYIYVYFVYGTHWMLNIVTSKKDYPAAVLIRGIEGVVGPGRLTNKLQIDGTLNGKKIIRRPDLWIEKRDKKIDSKMIKRSARIGVNYAGSIWSKKMWRFNLEK